MTSAIPPAMIDGVRRMNGSGRFLTLGALVVALIAIWAISRYGQASDLVPLYQGLELRDAATMADALQKAGIRYDFDAGGTAILVAKADLAVARVTVAKAGVRVGDTPTHDDFLSGTNIGRTDREMASLERRDLEEALSRSLAGMHGIARATVHLSLPEASPLRKLDRPAKASVVITTRGGMPLPGEAVASITYLVSNAVVNLQPDQVAVLDAEGRLLSAPNEVGGRGLTSRQLEVQRSVEDYLAGSAERMLGTILGPGEAKVQVNARLNFEQVEKSIETYNPDGAVLQNEQRSEVAGADSMAGGSSTVVNNTYQNSRVLETVVSAVGGIERLTVAVLINDQAITRVAGPSANMAQELGRYQEIVRDAIGMDSTRGDRITVLAQPFEPLAVGDTTTIPEGSGQKILGVAERFSRPLVGIAGILAALVLGLKALKSAPGLRNSGGGPAGGGSGAGAGDLAGAEGEGEFPPVKVPALSAATTRLKNEVQAESTQRPEMAASVVKAWLAEGG